LPIYEAIDFRLCPCYYIAVVHRPFKGSKNVKDRKPQNEEYAKPELTKEGDLVDVIAQVAPSGEPT